MDNLNIYSDSISGLQVQLINNPGGIVPNDGMVLFNTLRNDTSPKIDYIMNSGIFFINTAGTYLINWCLNINGAEASEQLLFTLELSDGRSFGACAPYLITNTFLYGSYLITVDTAPITFAVVNKSGSNVQYSYSPAQANMVII